MKYTFNPNGGLIIVKTELTGTLGSAVLRLALDTGATGTLINKSMIVSIGYEITDELPKTKVTTGSGIEQVPIIRLKKIFALGLGQSDFPVLCHTLPASSSVDGLIGLDFFREKELFLNFRKGEIILNE